MSLRFFRYLIDSPIPMISSPIIAQKNHARNVKAVSSNFDIGDSGTIKDESKNLNPAATIKVLKFISHPSN